MKAILVTGGAEFIGSIFIRYVLQRDENVRLVNLDALTCAGNLENLSCVSEDLWYTSYQGGIFGTDEVYGALGKTGQFTETTPLAPNSPCAASKAGAELIVRAYL